MNRQDQKLMEEHGKLLQRAVSLGNHEHVERLLQEVKMLSVVNTTVDANGHSYLHQAARADDDNHEMVSVLLAKGAKVDARSSEGKTPLHLAAVKGNHKIAKLLLRQGADINASSREGDTPLHMAAFSGNYKIAKLLLDRGAEVDARASQKKTPLHIAVFNGNCELVKLLLDKDADPNAVAEVYDSKECSEQLREFLWNSAQQTVPGKYVLGSTPLTLAIKQGNVEVTEVLLKYGANPNLRDYSTFTPLQIAIRAYKSLESGKRPVWNMIHILKRYGADPALGFHGGNTIDLINEYWEDSRDRKKLIEAINLACHFCNESVGKLMQACSRCKKVSYCSKKCQKADWKNHKENCRTSSER